MTQYRGLNHRFKLALITYQQDGNVTASNSNALSMEANTTGAANANNTNQSAPTATNTNAADASQSNASLSS